MEIPLDSQLQRAEICVFSLPFFFFLFFPKTQSFWNWDEVCDLKYVLNDPVSITEGSSIHINGKQT